MKYTGGKRYSLESQQRKLTLFEVPEERIYYDVKCARTLDERSDLQRLLKTFNREEKTREDKKVDLQQLKEKNLIKRVENYGVGFI